MVIPDFCDTNILTPNYCSTRDQPRGTLRPYVGTGGGVNMKGLHFVLLLLVLLCGEALASDQNDCYQDFGTSRSRNYISSSFQWENDSWLGNQTDRWYTNGMKYSMVDNPECNEGIVEKWIRPRNKILIPGWSLGMNMYTPARIDIRAAQPNDRPWSGWAYYGRNWQLHDLSSDNSTLKSKDQVEILVGVLGAWAHQDSVQKAWHQLIDATQPRGWENQSSGKPAWSLRYDHHLFMSFKPFEKGKWTSSLRQGVVVGTVVDQIMVGGTLSLQFGGPTLSGHFIPAAALSGATSNTIVPAIQFSPDEQSLHRSLATDREKWERSFIWWLFTDFEARYVRYNYFLKGTQITRVPFVGDFKNGLALKLPSYPIIRFTWITRSPEFKQHTGNRAPYQHFAQISLEWNWGMIKRRATNHERSEAEL